ncbi:MAG: choice-of-anchor L domain-containing protein, partial [Flavobacteriales bacterium]|nr:choice-of-anchor L domain-containing protein [Flavobacteriales bacterium]
MKRCYPLCLPLLAIAFIFSSNSLQGQFAVNDSLTVEELVYDFFDSGVLVEISNLTVNGQAPDSVNNQIVLFDNGLENGLDMDAGLSLATGYAKSYLIPNSGFENLTNPVTNDPDMMAITGQNVNDCAIIEFDVLVDADALAFNYIFTSSEYTSFTCSQFNDAFGFFISGPGLQGQYTNNAINIATIPDSQIPVAINTLNGGEPSYPGNSSYCEDANPNWQNDTVYFVDNTDNVNSPFIANGYTVTLEAFVEVTFGESYHMKIGICDAADGALDSAVLLEAGSFEGRLLSSTDDAKLPRLKTFPNPATDAIRI